MSTIVIDIETVPAQRPEHIEAITDEQTTKLSAALEAVKAPGNYKDAAKIAEYILAEQNKLKDAHDAAVEQAVLKTSFDGGYGQVICIGWSVDDAPAQSLIVRDLSPEQESSLLRDWFGALRSVTAGTSGLRPVIVGHNVISFDLPFLWKRAMVHGLRPPLWLPRNPKPWSESLFDTMTQWAGDRDRISLDKLCRVLGLEGKGDGPTGADVWPMAQAGRLDEIAKYCAQDVERARAIYRRMNFLESA